MSLELYKKKRNFKETPEPVSAKTKQKDKTIFVIQRHKASHLHYDFRLEMDGTLKSWAVPKGPSMNPIDKRLAMMVEDHPIDYAGFSGIIPEGNYGAGIVEIWDSGTYEISPENKGSGLAGIAKGSLKFIMKGKKLKGQFALVKLRNASENSWLLVKDRDDFAVDEEYNSELETPKSSPINKALIAEGKVVGEPTKTAKAKAKKAGAKKAETIADEATTPTKKTPVTAAPENDRFKKKA